MLLNLCKEKGYATIKEVGANARGEKKDSRL